MFSSVGIENALCASLEGLLLVSREQTPKLYIVIAVFKIYTPFLFDCTSVHPDHPVSFQFSASKLDTAPSFSKLQQRAEI